MHKSSRYIRSLFLISVVSSLTIGQSFAASYLSQVLPDSNTRAYSAPSVIGAGFSVPLFSDISPLSPSTFSLTSLTDSLASLVKQGPRIAKVSLLPLETYQSFALGGYSVQAQRAPSVTNGNAASFLDRLSLTVFCSLAANKDASRCSYDTLLALRGTPDTTTVLGYPVEQTPVAVATSTPSTSQPSPRVVYVPQYITNYVTEYVLGTPGRDGKDGKDGTSSALVNNTSIPSGFGSYSVPSVTSPSLIGATTIGYLRDVTIEKATVADSIFNGYNLFNNTAIFTGFVGINSLTATTSVLTNATITTSTTTDAFITNLTSTNNLFTNATTTNSYISSLVASSSTLTDAFLTNATTTNAYIQNLVAASSSVTDALFTNATTTNFVATNATSTSLFAQALTAVSSFFTNLTATNATTTNLIATNATSTNLFAGTGFVTNLTTTAATSTNLFSTNAFFTNLDATNINLGNATTTNFIATNATTTRLFTQNLAVGNATTQGNQTVNGDLTVNGTTTIAGNITLGTSTATYVSFNGLINSNIIPAANKMYDLGSPSFYWRDLYADNINVNSISAASTTISGTSNDTFSINSDNGSSDAQDSSLVFFRGLVTPNALLRWNATTKRLEANMSFKVQNETPITGTTTLTVQGGAGQGTTNLLEVKNNGGTTLTVIDAQGRVGIGSSTPGSALTVVGNAYVGGNVTATGTLDVTGQTTLSTASSTGLTATNLYSTNTVLTNATSTFFAAVNATTTNATTTRAYITSLVAASSTLSDALLTRSTSTDAYITRLVAASSTLTDVIVTTLNATSLTATNATLTNASTTNLSATGATLTNLFSSVLNAVTAGFTNLTTTNATSTNLFSSVLTAVTGTVNTLTGGSITATSSLVSNGTLNVTGQTTLANASSSNFSISANAYFSGNTGIWNSSGNVGIGTTTVSSRLTVGGNDQALEFLGTGINRINASNAAATLALRVNGADRLTVLSTGSVGIGTTTPETALTVRGSNTVLTTDPNVLAARFGAGSGGSNAGVGVGSYTGGYGAVQGLAFNSSAGTYLYFNPAGGNVGIGSASGLGSAASALSVSGGTAIGSGYWATAAPANGLVVQGSVGVGTSSPSAKLHVVGGDIGFPYGSAIRVSPENTALWSSGTTKLVETGWNGSTDFVSYYTPGSVRSTPVITMLASGNVGIGTTTPQSKLEVTEAGTGSGSGGLTLSTANVTGNAGLKFATAGSNRFSITTIGSGGSESLRFRDENNNAERMRISSNGNVGIGTTTPVYKLDVVGGGIRSDLSSGGYFDLSYANVVKGNLTVDATRMYVNTQTTNTIINANGGNVGIGTASPGERLEINAGAGDSSLRLSSTAIGAKSWNLTAGGGGNYTAGNFAIRNVTDATTPFFISSGGNVGIGTTGPGVNLEVNAAAPTRGILSKFVNTSSNTTGAYLSIAASGANVWSMGLPASGSPDFAFFSGRDETSDGNERMRITSTGNVGIGITNPGAGLEVSSSAANVPIFKLTSTESGGDGYLAQLGSYSILSQDSAGALHNSWGSHYNGATDAWVRDYTGLPLVSTKLSTNGEFMVNTDTATSGTPSFVTRFMVANSGNVGIGTTNPGTRLDIRGPDSLPVYVRSDDVGSYMRFLTSNTVSRGAFGYNADGAQFFNGALNATNMTILDGGNVGIGTTNPSLKLEVTAGAGLTPLALTSGTERWEVGQNAGAGSSDNSFGFYSSTYGAGHSYAPIMTMLNTGNVGIGSTAPGYKLTVNPTTQYTGINTGDGLQINGGTIGTAANLVFGLSGTTANVIQSRDGTSLSWPLAINPFGGNVGIGTTNPGAKLEVQTAGATSTFFQTGQDTAGNTSVRRIAFQQVNFRNAIQGQVAAWTPGDLLLNADGGNIGIGNTAPGSLLHVGGGAATLSITPTAQIAAASGSSTLAIAASNASTNSAQLWLENLGQRNWTLEASRGQDAFNIAINNGANKLFTVLAGGNVGVGTTNPGSLLQVGNFNTAANTLVTIDAAAASQAGFNIRSAGTNVAQIYRPANSTDLRIYGQTLGADIITLNTTSGNIGIGTTSPSTQLHLASAAPNAGGLLIESTSGTSGGIANIELRGRRDDTNGSTPFGGSLYLSRIYTPGNMVAGVNDTFSQLGNILFGGNAGGTTAASIVYPASIGGIVEGTFTSSTSASTGLVFRTGSTGQAKDAVNTQFGTERMRITSTGNIGIGTSTPDDILTINKTTGDAMLKFVDAGSARSYFGFTNNTGGVLPGTVDNDTVLRSQTNLAIGTGGYFTRLFLASGGNIGIGTTTPESAFQINATSSQIIFAPSGSGTETTDNIGFEIRSNNYANGPYASRFVKADEGGGIPLYIQNNENGDANTWINNARFGSYTGNNNKFETFGQTSFATGGGNVGIGTTTPSAKLTVSPYQGGIGTLVNGATAFIVGESTTLGSATGSYLYPQELQSNAGNVLRLQTAVYRRVAGSSWNGTGYRIQYGVDQSFTDGSKAYIEVGAGDPSVVGGGFLAFGTAGSDRLTINNAGNVGIGTTTPGTKLLVTGEIRSYDTFPGFSLLQTNNTGVRAIMGNDGKLYFQDTANAFSSTVNNILTMVTGSGNVGIGTTTPGSRLTVAGDTLVSGVSPVITLASTGNLWTMQAVNGAQFRISEAGTSERFTIAAGGNVGIGTTTPTAQLAVKGNGTGIALIGDSGFSTFAGISLNGTLNTTDYNFTSSVGDRNLYINRPTGFETVFREANAVTNMVIKSGGNVGIGTTTAATRLYVASGNSGVTPVAGTALTIDSGGNNFLSLLSPSANASGVTFGNMLSNADGGIYYNGVTSRGLDFRTAGNATKMVIDASGNVGIGTTTPASKLVVTGTTTLVGSAAGPTALKVVGNIDNTTTGSIPPRLVSSVGTFRPTAIFVSGNYLYVTNKFNNTLSVIDTTNIQSPATISTVVVGSNPVSVVVSGRYAYVANRDSNTMSVVDISNPAALSVVATVSTGTSPNTVYVSGKYAYVTNSGTNTVSIFDIANPSAPTIVSTPTVGNNPNSIYISGKYAYVANYGSNSLSIIDVSNPSSPTTMSTPATGTGPQSVYVSGKYAYVANYASNSLSIIDVSNPSSPSTVSTPSTGGSLPNAVRVSGRYAYVTNNNDSVLSVLDVSNPSSVVVSTSVIPSSPGLLGLYISGRYAYLAEYNLSSVSIYDIGGLETNGAIIASLEAGNAQIRNDLTVQGGIFTQALNAVSAYVENLSAKVLSLSSLALGAASNVATNALLSLNLATSGTELVTKNSTAGFSVAGSTATVGVSTSSNMISLSLASTTSIGNGTMTAGPSLATGTLDDGGHAILRPDGKYLIINGNATTATNIYDPVANTFVAGPTLSSGSVQHGGHSIQRPDGKFLVINANNTAATNIYDPIANTFTTGPSFSTGVANFGSHSILRPDGKYLVINASISATTNIYDPVANSFAAGPSLATSTAYAGSHSIQRPDGKFLVINGNQTNATNIYDPVANTFVAGPTLASGTAFTGSHSIQRPDGRFLVINANNTTTTNIYDPVANTFVVGPSLSNAPNHGSHSIQRPDGKWLVVIAGTSSATEIYDPITNTFSAGPTLASGSAFNGSFSLQRPDGKYLIVNGNVSATTNIYDPSYVMSGVYESEDMLMTDLNQSSVLNFTTNGEGKIEVAIKTATSTAALAASYTTYATTTSGSKIFPVSGAQYAKVRVTLSRSIPTDRQPYVGSKESGTWLGESDAKYQRSFANPILYSFSINNQKGYHVTNTDFGTNSASTTLTSNATSGPVVSSLMTGDGGLTLPYTTGIPGNSTITDERGSITPGPNLTATVFSGASAIHRPDGKILIIHGQNQNTTTIFDPVTSTSTVGPTLTTNVYYGSHSFQRPDGKFVVFLGNTSAGTNIYDPVANTFSTGPSVTAGTIYFGAHTIQLSNGKFLTVNGGNTQTTNIYDPITNTFTQGPSLTANADVGSFTIKRPDGRFLTIHGNSLSSTSVYDPTANVFYAGPSTNGAAAGAGAMAFQRPDGKFLIVLGGAGPTTNIYDPFSNTLAAGPTNITYSVGSGAIQRPDGKFTLVPGGAGANTRMYDPYDNSIGNVGFSFVSGAPSNGGMSIPLPNGKFLIVTGNTTATTNIYDPGWNTRGYYESEFINDTTLDSNSTFVWKGNADAYKPGVVSVRVRTATSTNALQTASWRTLPVSGSRINPGTNEVWMQVRIEMNRSMMQAQPGALKNVSVSESGNVVYNRLPLLGSAGYTNQAEVFVKPTIYSYAIQKQEGQDLATFQVNGNSVFRFSATGDAYTSAGGSWNAGGADVAEYFPTEDGLLEPGDVVSVNSDQSAVGSGLIRMTVERYDEQILGIVTTAPGLRLGSDDIGANQGKQPIALAGRVPVKVTLENGVIKKGDYLTSSSRPGFAMKALDAGRVIGIALEDYTLEMDTQNNGAGKVLTFVNPHFYMGATFTEKVTSTFSRFATMIQKGVAELGVTITDAGNVGVGTTNPLSRFHVAGDARLGVASTTSGALIFQNEANGYATTLRSATSTLTGDLTLTLPDSLGKTTQALMTDGAGYTYWGTVARVNDTDIKEGYLPRFLNDGSLVTGSFLDDGVVTGINATSTDTTFTVKSTASTTYAFSVFSRDNNPLFTIGNDGAFSFGTDVVVASGGDIFTKGTLATEAEGVSSMYTAVEALDIGTVVAFADIDTVGTSTQATSTESSLGVQKATSTLDAIGVVTSRSGITLGTSTVNGVPVAFAGRVPVKVTTENGEVKRGDYLTVSKTIPGYAMKLTGEGKAIGRALSGYTQGNDKVMMLVENGYQKLNLLGTTASTTGMLTTGNVDLNANGVAIYNIKSLASANGTWSIDEHGRIVGKTLCIEDVCIDKATLTNILQATGQISVNTPLSPTTGTSTGETGGVEGGTNQTDTGTSTDPGVAGDSEGDVSEGVADSPLPTEPAPVVQTEDTPADTPEAPVTQSDTSGGEPVL